jgi:hypothetical protein
MGGLKRVDALETWLMPIGQERETKQKYAWHCDGWIDCARHIGMHMFPSMGRGAYV